ncbi:helix-turn-helix domain-containing protein [Haliscomenobacter hydrossis]|uniref:Transcriptional regulator, AraC family n=1 Tax=Haliscomenobacter hydrossis (strain ATCC 27775 / DSM 1100 / LMG 10767 / O) TaxID=760192 RepID=F4KZ44_HALH1|nr:AraC family transcriptional regulator [Haliscomenobacter hydrossis]AEE53698.1 transcriptional regulator, AraC family [Haliscomenobacter hydrossis DSM 1100]
MKPQLLKITPPPDSSFNLFVQDAPYFAAPWHYHPDYEIVLVMESTGKRFVGSNISNFKPGDLCMIGAYLPHYYRNEEMYYAKNSSRRAKSLVIHFLEDFMGGNFFGLPECQSLKSLLERSKLGLNFGPNAMKEVAPKIVALQHQDGLKRIMELIAILRILSESEDVQELSASTMSLQHEVDSARINGVLSYIIQNYQEEIHLGDMARLANMSESAFSRYFKKRTRRTFSQFITEIRIEHACKLLVQDKMSISAISVDSGFNNLSNFNRQFKMVKQTTPLAYRSSFTQ